MVVKENHYWVVDVEGNGGNPPEIIELAMVEVADLKLTGRQHHWFVRPKQPILPTVSRIHGLTDADVADAPSMESIAKDVFKYLRQAPLVGHNVRVEVDIISRSIPEWRPDVAIDTLRLSKALKPGLESYALQKLGVALGLSDKAASLSGRGHHSALYDAILTALIFNKLLSSVDNSRRFNVVRDADIFDQRQGTLL